MHLNRLKAISVIIITHNRIKYLSEAIECISNQSIRPLEIIIVDDGSNPPIKDQFKDTALKLTDIPIAFARIEDLGPSAARNYGASKAKGDILAFLDDDDLWHSDYLENILELINKHNVHVVITWMKEFYNEGFSTGKRIPPNFKNMNIYRTNLGITGSNLVIQKQVYNEIGGFDEELLASEDKDILIKLVKNNFNIKVLEKEMVFHRNHPVTQLSGNRSINRFKIDGKKKFLKKYRDDIDILTYLFLKSQLCSIRYKSGEISFKKVINYFGHIYYIVFSSLIKQVNRIYS